ncbi:UDP-glucose/GDP-mannose dehydrogenase family protein [Dyella sp. A6]|uniref:UDP-glucose dehydrogenase family protein n=1 Tax=Dyella aluminiiresistens TaxID=3069105 RepID=UPI002E7A99FF|nr:UDP-glucose/GDP-mannose dehydrogenase family protein [Dyella sp. A6]
MKVTVIGSGYVGLVSGACLSETGNDVLCFDVNQDKIDMLNNGVVPIHEPGLKELIQRNVKAGRLHFTSSAEIAVKHGAIQFIAVGTPPDEDGSADLQYVLAAATSIGKYMDGYKVVVDKSTVPVGTADKVKSAICAELVRRGLDTSFSVVSNPEFLKEGAAIDDFMSPDRVVIGSEDPKAIEIMRALYAPYVRNHDRMIVMNARSAELTKYAANSMLATRISFMNELALLAEETGADIESVRLGIGSDSRIGYSFLYPGCGYGGSCFPKDVKALVKTAKDHGQHLHILSAVEDVNERQKHVLVDKVRGSLGAALSGANVAIWGLAFKPNTDDMREAASRVIIEDLFESGATVTAYDPVAMDEAARIYGEDSRIRFAASPLEACMGADALIIITEWKEFRNPDFDAVKRSLRRAIIFDGRNIYSPDLVRIGGFEYHSIGRR